MTLGRRMQLARIKKGLTQKELAEFLGFETAQFISNLERGKAPVPAHIIPRLAVQQVAARFARLAAPLLEEEGDAEFSALPLNLLYPFFLNRPGFRAAFPANDYPLEISQIFTQGDRFQHRFYGKEPDLRRNL